MNPCSLEFAERCEVVSFNKTSADVAELFFKAESAGFASVPLSPLYFLNQIMISLDALNLKRQKLAAGACR